VTNSTRSVSVVALRRDGPSLEKAEKSAHGLYVIPLPERVPEVSTVTRLTTKHQTTVPLEVRRALGLEAGDHVEFRVEGTSVTLHKVDRQLTDDLVFGLVQTHAMRDWDTPEDDEAFRDF
jgi:antitoxin PrlF